MSQLFDSTRTKRQLELLPERQQFLGDTDAAATEPEPPAPKRRGFLGWIGSSLSIPVRLVALAIVVFFVPFGVNLMCQLTKKAEEHRVDLSLVSLRAINREKAVRPLLALGYREKVQQKLINIAPDVGYKDFALDFLTFFTRDLRLEKRETSRTPDGQYRHVLHFSDGTSRTVVSTTPHTFLTREEIEEARSGLEKLFPQSQQREQFLQWGASLFFTEWIYDQSFSTVPRDSVPEPFDGTEDERTWIVWTVLRGDQPNADEELPRLYELFETAFPGGQERATALEWARRLYERLTEDYSNYRKLIEADEKQAKEQGHSRTDSDQEDSALASLERVLPPESEWTHLWLLYRFVGLSESSRAAARAHWLSRFPEGSAEEVIALGERLVTERRSEGEPLPNVAETLPLLCVVERLTWTDGHGQRCREAIQTLTRNDKMRTQSLEFGILACYPNDEMFYLVATNDSLRMYPFARSGTPTERVERVFGHSIFLLLGSLGIATLLHWIIAPLFLRGGAKELWREHREGRGSESVWMWVASVVVFGLIGTVLAPFTLPEFVGVQVGSFSQLLLASLVATAVGGVLIGTCRRILALALIFCRVDLEQTWLDEILGIIAGGSILMFFGNDLLAVALFALADLAPGVVSVLWSRRGATPALEAA